MTELYPIVQFKEDTYEIDEFDCASIFLLVGSEKALLIDTGIGIGDLRGAVSRITQKPVIVALTHGHGDHTGNAWQFPEVYIGEKDFGGFHYETVEKRKNYAATIAKRMHGCLPSVYQVHNLYGYDIDKDIVPPDPVKVKDQKVTQIRQGYTFDLGGGRIVTAYECQGHTPGQMMFLDEMTRSLFVGDALNYNLGVSGTPVEVTIKGLQTMVSLSDKYDGIYNGHHDFRALGAPLGTDCLPNAIKICEAAIDGSAVYSVMPNFMGPDRPPVRMAVCERNFMGLPE